MNDRRTVMVINFRLAVLYLAVLAGIGINLLAADDSERVMPIMLDQREGSPVAAAAMTTALAAAVMGLPREHRYSIPDLMPSVAEASHSVPVAAVATGVNNTELIPAFIPFTGTESYGEMNLKLLLTAVAANNPVALEVLMEARGVSPDLRIVHPCATPGCHCSTSLLGEIIFAAPRDNPELLKPLFKRNARLDTLEAPLDTTPLITAISLKKPQLALALLAHEAAQRQAGAPDRSTLRVSYNSPQVGTALIAAADRVQPAVVTALCQHPEIKDFINAQHTADGRTALVAAVLQLHSQLRQYPATVTVTSPTVVTVNTLTAAGADPTITALLLSNRSRRPFNVLDYVAKKKLAHLLPGLARVPGPASHLPVGAPSTRVLPSTAVPEGDRDPQALSAAPAVSSPPAPVSTARVSPTAAPVNQTASSSSALARAATQRSCCVIQ